MDEESSARIDLTPVEPEGTQDDPTFDPFLAFAEVASYDIRGVFKVREECASAMIGIQLTRTEWQPRSKSKPS